MWSQPSFDPQETPAENAVLEAMSSVVVKHLRDAERPNDDGDTPPMLIQVDGPGRTELLNKLEDELDPPRHRDEPRTGSEWTAVRFDAWKHQRLDPPWWWLMNALDKRIRARAWEFGWSHWLRQRSQDVWWRLVHLLMDLRWVLPGALLAFLGWLLWEETMVPALGWLMGAAGGISALLAFVSSISNALRRHLLAESPRGTQRLLRSSDPMEELLRRYSFLVRSAGTSIIVLIDNLDRCRAEYVVQMLEGIQTLLRNPHAAEPRSLKNEESENEGGLIAFVVAADRGWLCDSYRHVYDEFEATTREPGRPFGLVFVDKVFDVALRVPTVPAATTTRSGPADCDPFAGCADELEIRRTLREVEQQHGRGNRRSKVPPPVPALRQKAVLQLAENELGNADPASRYTLDTFRQLDEVLGELDPGPAVKRQLATAYCVQRSTQLLAGHAVDAGDEAIYRLALWTILDLKWPRLASRLARHPQDLKHLGADTAPDDFDEDLKLVLADPVAHRLAHGVAGVKLAVGDIKKFTAPLRSHLKPHGELLDRSTPAAA